MTDIQLPVEKKYKRNKKLTEEKITKLQDVHLQTTILKSTFASYASRIRIMENKIIELEARDRQLIMLFKQLVVSAESKHRYHIRDLFQYMEEIVKEHKALISNDKSFEVLGDTQQETKKESIGISPDELFDFNKEEEKQND